MTGSLMLLQQLVRFPRTSTLNYSSMVGMEEFVKETLMEMTLALPEVKTLSILSA